MVAIDVEPEVKRGRNKLAATVVLGHTVKHIYNSGLQSIILAVIKDDLNLSGSQFGLLSTSGRVTGGMTTMVAGYLGDRFANRSGVMLMISLAIMGISYFLLGSAPNYWALFIVMLLVGIGPSLFHPPAIASLSRKFPDRRGFAISLHGTGGSVGEVVGPILTGGLITGTYLVAFHWRTVLHISVIPALFFAVAMYLMMKNIPTADEGTSSLREYFSSLFNLSKELAMISLIAVTAIRSMGQGAIIAFLPVYLLQDQDYSAVQIGLFMAGAQVTGIGAQPVMGYLSDKFGRKVVLVPSMVVLGVMMFALKYADPGAQLILTILAMGAFLYSLHTIFIAGAMDVARGQSQSTVVSLIYGASFLGAFSPWIAGAIVDASGTTNAFVYGGIMVLIGTAILVVTRMPRTANQMAVH